MRIGEIGRESEVGSWKVTLLPGRFKEQLNIGFVTDVLLVFEAMTLEVARRVLSSASTSSYQNMISCRTWTQLGSEGGKEMCCTRGIAIGENSEEGEEENRLMNEK
jgi:hypothetical protein